MMYPWDIPHYDGQCFCDSYDYKIEIIGEDVSEKTCLGCFRSAIYTPIPQKYIDFLKSRK